MGGASEAWEDAKKLKKASKDVGKIAEEVKAAGEGAQEAVKKAKELDAKMTKLYEATRARTVAAATEAAMAYYQKAGLRNPKDPNALDLKCLKCFQSCQVKEAGARGAAQALNAYAHMSRPGGPSNK